MKPTVAANQAHENAGPGGNGAPVGGAGSGINIPISREYVSGGYGSPQRHQPAPQQPQFHGTQPACGSPRQQFQPHQQMPPNQHFQSTFGFEPDMDMDMDNMFPRSRLGRMHDPFAGFGDSHFGFPQFSTMGRRGRMQGGANNHMEHDDDFFNRLPSEFRQYIPDAFGGRRGPAGAAANVSGQTPPQQQHPQQYPPQQYQYVPPQQQQHPQQQYQYAPAQQHQPVYAAAPQQQVPQSPSKNLCDAAIQTEDPAGRSEVDCAPPSTLNQHGLRNTVDMGVKSVAEQDQGARSHSAPPPEQLHQNLLHQQQQQRNAAPSAGQQQQFGTQTSPPVQGQYHAQQQPQFKTYYAPQQQTNPQQRQQSPAPAPQTPGGSYIRTIPIFVEGRSEPIINAHKEIPNQSAPSSGQAHAQAETQPSFAPQQHRPTPLNTQSQQPHPDQQVPVEGSAAAGLPPQTPHTLDSINKIQDIQRDVLELMGKVEQFKGTRQDKEYVYLDEMLTRNLLKLDTIDTNGKDSIRLARKEAIKCIQASINVLEAKAEENARAASGAAAAEPSAAETVSSDAAAAPEAAEQTVDPVTPQDATKIQEPIPLPAPPNAGQAEGASAPDASGEPLASPAAAVEVNDTTEQTKTATSTSE